MAGRLSSKTVTHDGLNKRTTKHKLSLNMYAPPPPPHPPPHPHPHHHHHHHLSDRWEISIGDALDEANQTGTFTGKNV